jgi:hypothetical protein
MTSREAAAKGFASMTALRAFLFRHRLLAVWLVAAALCVKMVVPAGLMVSSDAKVLTIRICADSLGHDGLATVAVPMKGAAGKTGAAGKGECAFGALSMASMAGADPALLALALAFILLLGFASTPAPHLRRLSRLRPPLRGPPAHT